MQNCSSCFPKSEPEKDVLEEESYYSTNTKSSGRVSRSNFFCCWQVSPKIPFSKRHGMYETSNHELKSESSVELAVEAQENLNFECTEILNPKVPFVEDLPAELYQGKAIEIQGKLLKNANRFSINLCTGSCAESDIGLHFNPRIDRHVIVRNHRIKNKWGVEEKTSLAPFPFSLGRNFSVLIFIADEQFLIAINRIHYCAFAFRIPINKIRSLIITGDITLKLLQHSARMHYPPEIFKKTPFIIVPHLLKTENRKCYFRRKIKVINVGSKIEIYGRLRVLPRAFYVNLQKGITLWPHPEIPFHMNYRLHPPGSNKNEREIIFNSWKNGFWGKEEIISLCPFLPGTPFHIRIVCASNGYNVFVNDKFLFNYTKKSDTPVDSVVIHGDVVISKVLLH